MEDLYNENLDVFDIMLKPIGIMKDAGRITSELKNKAVRNARHALTDSVTDYVTRNVRWAYGLEADIKDMFALWKKKRRIRFRTCCAIMNYAKEYSPEVPVFEYDEKLSKLGDAIAAARNKRGPKPGDTVLEVGVDESPPAVIV